MPMPSGPDRETDNPTTYLRFERVLLAASAPSCASLRMGSFQMQSSLVSLGAQVTRSRSLSTVLRLSQAVAKARRIDQHAAGSARNFLLDRVHALATSVV